MWRREDDIQSMLRDSANGVLSSEHSAGRVRDLRGTTPGYATAFWARMAEMGWTGLLVLEEDGGSGLGLAPALTLAECFGEHLVPEPFVSSAIMAAALLQPASGPAAAQARQALAAGTRVILPALPEDADTLPVLSRNGGASTLSGTARMVADWTAECQVIVACAGPSGIALALLESAAADAEVQRMADGTWCADLTLNAVEVAPGRVLLEGAKAQTAIDTARAFGTLGLCAYLEGLSHRLMQTTIGYVRQRSQFDKHLSDFQALRHGIVDLNTQHELASASWRFAAQRIDRDGATAAAGTVSSAKARANVAASGIARAAVQYHGAFGYTEEADVGLYLNAVLRNVARMGSSREHRMAALRHHRNEAKSDA